MKLNILPANDGRFVQIPGVSRPVSRPVDIQQSLTGFHMLRTLRIYRFDENTVIEGHAEEDEVYVILLAGSLEFTIETIDGTLGPTKIAVPAGPDGAVCGAYLPPGASYRLASVSGADVAYARSTPTGTRLPRLLSASPRTSTASETILVEDLDSAERLRLRLTRIETSRDAFVWDPLSEAAVEAEALLHLGATQPAAIAFARVDDRAQPTPVHPWDTLAISPGCRPKLEFTSYWNGLALLVWAV